MIKFGNYKRIFGLLGKIAIIAIVFGSSFIFGSCEKYLDIEKYVYDQTTLDSIFLSRSRTEEYINGAAALLPDESKQTGNDWGEVATLPSGLGSDEGIVPNVWASNAILYDEVTETNSRYNPWPNCYKGIRRLTLFWRISPKTRNLLKWKCVILWEEPITCVLISISIW